MRYACKACGHRETVWNSRDGVTPFGANCPDCPGMMNHVEWHTDEYAPNHQLLPGQRFWRDGTPDEAEQIMRKRIEATREKYPLSAEQETGLLSSARLGMDEFRPGWPTLDMKEGEPTNDEQ